MQAITTKYLPATNTRGGRIKATAQAGSITIEWDHRLNLERNHAAAAKALARKLGWTGRWMGGGLPGSGFAFVPVSDDYFDVAAEQPLVPLRWNAIDLPWGLGAWAVGPMPGSRYVARPVAAGAYVVDLDGRQIDDITFGTLAGAKDHAEVHAQHQQEAAR